MVPHIFRMLKMLSVFLVKKSLQKFLCCFEFTLSVGLNVCSNVISTDKTTQMSRRRILGVHVREIT